MKIGVLMGGVSSEREISLQSGEEIVKNLDRSKYEVFPIIINQKHEVADKVKGMDFVFIALHGEFGEDGEVQAVLESVGIPYSGCGVTSSAICMNKEQTKRVARSEGLYVPVSIRIRKGEELSKETLKRLKLPLVVKPNKGGSSIGTFLVRNFEQLEAHINEALNYDEEVLLEEYIEGKEYTIPMIGGEVYPILEIKPKAEFFDYKAKYTAGETDEIKAELSNELEEKIKQVSKTCWEIFDCKGFVRIDIIVRDEKIYILELNTLPGMTKNSLVPKSAALIGLSYTQLLDKMIESSQVDA